MPPIVFGLDETDFRGAAGFVGARTVWKLSQGEESCTLPLISQRGHAVMPRQSSEPDDAKIAANLRRAIELTELGLDLRRSVIQQHEPHGAWQQNHS